LNVCCNFQDEINTLPVIPSGSGATVKKNEINQSFDDIIFGVAISNGTYITSGIRWQERCRYTKGLGKELSHQTSSTYHK
jgi:hypothetical protein